MSSESASIQATSDQGSARPVTPADVASALRSAGVDRGDLVIVHSSLSRLGWVVGGAQTVVQALLEVVGESGTVVMPAQTGVSDPSLWENPPVPQDWWPIIRDTWPAFDPHLTPVRAMGAVVESFRRMPGVLYSGHPSLGFVAYGPLANEITATHTLAQSLSDDSPLGVLYRHGARIVMMGVGHGNNTSLHLAEHRADYPTKKNVESGAPLLVEGKRTWVTYSDLDHDEDDFEAIGAAFVADGGEQPRAPLGTGSIETCSMPVLIDYAVSWMHTNRR